MNKAHAFELNPEVSEADFLSASDKMQAEFYDKYDNLESRELLKLKNIWIEILRWEGSGPPKTMQEAFFSSKVCMAFMGMINMKSFKDHHLEQVRVHDKSD